MDDEVFFEETLKELGTVYFLEKLNRIPLSFLPIQLLGDDMRLIVVFQMLVMATQVISEEAQTFLVKVNLIMVCSASRGKGY